MEIEDDAVWEEMQESWDEVQKKTDPELHMYIYGKVVPYNNSWGFRLDPLTTISYLSPISAWSKSRNTIENVANNLSSALSHTYAFYFKNIRFYNSEYAGVFPFLIDMIITGAVIILFSLYFLVRRERKLSTKIKEELLNTKEMPEGITFIMLSQKVGLKQQRIEHLLTKNNLKENMGLHIADELIRFKDLMYSQSIDHVEEQMKGILQLSIRKLTADHFSKLSQLKKDLEEALSYFKSVSNLEKQKQIDIKLKVITDLLDSITLESIAEKK
ncbi:MAG: hypothetical protein ACTSSK_06705 [Candidatus Heimdallarchaeota archaeon]